MNKLIAEIAGTMAFASAWFATYFAMTDAVSISIITSISAVAMASISAYFAYKASVTSKETHLLVNSEMDKFREMAKKTYRAEGVLVGTQQEASRQAGLEKAKEEGAKAQIIADIKQKEK